MGRIHLKQVHKRLLCFLLLCLLLTTSVLAADTSETSAHSTTPTETTIVDIPEFRSAFLLWFGILSLSSGTLLVITTASNDT